jgi:hypothetical protein
MAAALLMAVRIFQANCWWYRGQAQALASTFLRSLALLLPVMIAHS